MQRIFFCLCILVLTGLKSIGQPFQITSFQGNGVLTFNQTNGAISYAIEWAPSLSGPWHTNWSGLDLILPASNGTVSVSVPMFYRVKATTVPTPQNFVTLNTTVHNNVIDGETRGAYNNTHDGDTNTYYGAYRLHPGDGDGNCSITSEHTWTTPAHINKFHSKMSSLPYPHGNYIRYQYTFEIWLRENNVWVKEYSDDSGYVNGGVPETVRDITLTSGWDAVTGIRAYVYTDAYSYEGDREQETWASVYEVEAWGN